MFDSQRMSDIDGLVEFVRQHRRITVLSGAGCSTASGIPDYRDENGNWKIAQPVQYGEFVNSGDVRKRYWARSYAGWTRVSSARPNAAHRALAALELAGHVRTVVTQNVDNLHRLAGEPRRYRSARRAAQDPLLGLRSDGSEKRVAGSSRRMQSRLDIARRSIRPGW